MNTIQFNWEEYKKCIPAGASATQIRETKRAFYAGAHSTLYILNNLGEANFSEEASLAVLQGISEESQEFLKNLAAGKE